MNVINTFSTTPESSLPGSLALHFVFFIESCWRPEWNSSYLSTQSIDSDVWNMMCCQFLAPFCSSNDMEMCSLKVLELEGSPSRMLLRLMGERGCTTGHLIDYLHTLGNSEALQCLKPSGTLKPPLSLYTMLLSIQTRLSFVLCVVFMA